MSETYKELGGGGTVTLANANSTIITTSQVEEKTALDVAVVETVSHVVVQWTSDTQFDAGTKINTQVVGTGDNAAVEFVVSPDNDDHIPYTTPANYDYNPAEIEVVGGVAKLKGTVSNVNDWPYTTPADYTYNSSIVEIASGVARLKDQGSTPETWDIPFTTPENYMYDSDKVQVIGGEAKVKYTASIVAWWHLNESSGTNVPDSSGNGYDGTTQNMDDSNWVSGKLNNCLNFTRLESEYVDCADSDLGSFEYTDAFAGEAWVYKSQTTMITPVFNKMSPSYIGWFFGVSDLKVYMQLRNGGNYIAVSSTPAIPLNTWTHIAFSYDGSGVASGITFWINGVPAAHTGTNNLAGKTIVNTTNFKICSGLAGGLAWWEGMVDELVLYDDEINQTFINTRYNSGSGTENMEYWTTNPTIYKTTGLTEEGGVASWSGFVETSTKTGNDEIKYNLSDDDGSTWYYWNGAAWVSANGTYTQSNTASEVNANIGSFPTDNNKINVKVFLHSDDGTSTPALDNVEVSYITNVSYVTTDPIVETNIGWAYVGVMSAFIETSTKPGSTEIKYIISSDNGVTYKYWTGAAWAISNGTYAEASTASDINSNLGTFTAGGTLKVKAFLHTSSAANRPLLDNVYVVDELSFPTDDDLYVDTKNASQIDPLVNYAWISSAFASVKPANTDIKVLLSVDGRLNWLTWNGSAWVQPASAVTRLNATDIADVEANFVDLPLGDGTLDIRIFLKTDSVLFTPEIEDVEVLSDTGYPTTGSWESAVYNSTYFDNDWLITDWISTVPSGTTLELKYRTANYTADLANTSYSSAIVPGSDLVEDGRYIQFKAEFTGPGGATPVLDSLETRYRVYSSSIVRP